MRHLPVLTVLILGGAVAACGPDDGDGDGACVEALLPGDLVITEFFADADAAGGASGADEGKEWIEVYNASGRALDLQGLGVTLARPDGSRAKTHTMRAQVVQPGAYLVLGNVLAELAPGYVDYGYGADLGDMFNTDGGQVTLACGAATIDVAGFEAVVVGASQQFDGGAAPDYTANDDLTRWCTATPAGSTEFAEVNFGTPGDANQECTVVVAGQCDDGGTARDTVPPAPGDLVITEIMPSPDAVDDTAGEWVEVLVTADVDLNGVAIDRAGDSRAPDAVEREACVRVLAGTYVVFARDDVVDTNGGLADVVSTFGFSMVGGSVASPGDVQLLVGDQVIDQFTWTGGVSNGTSLQVDPDFATAAANDMERYWCVGTTPYGAGDLGTPGVANAECAILPGAGMCVGDGGLERAIVAPTTGQLLIEEWMPNPAAPITDATGEWFEVRATADVDLNGLQVGAATLGANAIVANADCVRLAAGARALFARSGDAHGTGQAITATFNTALAQDNGQLRIGVGGAELDAVSWVSSSAGRSIMLDSDGTQCNAPAGVASYDGGTNVGTPLAVNSPPECP